MVPNRTMHLKLFVQFLGSDNLHTPLGHKKFLFSEKYTKGFSEKESLVYS